MPSKRVLVVDDDPVVRSVLIRMLEGAGYVGLETAGAQAALDYVLQHLDDVALVIVNQRLRDMPGDELAEKVHQAKPGQCVLRVLGNADDAVLRPANGCRDLVKPFRPDELVQVLGELIGPA